MAQASLDPAHQGLALLTPQPGNRKAVALRTTLEQALPLRERVSAQTRRRVVKGQSGPAADKVGSVFEPHTALIQRGKVPPRATAFGRKVWYSEVDGGLVSEDRLLPGNPPDNQDQGATSLQPQRNLFGHPPTTATADRGVHSRANEALAHSERIPEVALAQPGAKTPERRADEAQPWCKAALRFGAGIEGRLSVLRGPRGLRRCLNRGEAGTERWVGWGVLTNNLVVMATALTRRRRSRRAATM